MLIGIAIPFLLTMQIVRVIFFFYSFVEPIPCHKLGVTGSSRRQKAGLMRSELTSGYLGHFIKDNRDIFNIIGGSINRQFWRCYMATAA